MRPRAHERIDPKLTGSLAPAAADASLLFLYQPVPDHGYYTAGEPARASGRHLFVNTTPPARPKWEMEAPRSTSRPVTTSRLRWHRSSRACRSSGARRLHRLRRGLGSTVRPGGRAWPLCDPYRQVRSAHLRNVARDRLVIDTEFIRGWTRSRRSDLLQSQRARRSTNTVKLIVNVWPGQARLQEIESSSSGAARLLGRGH